MPYLEQTSFAGGVISEDVSGRNDLAKVAVALRDAMNCIVQPEGPVANRQGTRMAQQAPGPARLRRFKFSVEQQYILEFGDQYLRVIRDGSYVYESNTFHVQAATKASPMVITSLAHGWNEGDEFDLSGIFPELEGVSGFVSGLTTNTAEVFDLDGNPIDSTGFGTFTASSIARVYQLDTPYLLQHVRLVPDDETQPGLKFKQSKDVLTIMHPLYQTMELSRTDHDAWSLDPATFEPATPAPGNVTVSVGTSGSTTTGYVVTAIDEETGEESLRGTSTQVSNITAITRAKPCVITVDSVGTLDPSDEVYLDSIVGMVELNGRRVIIDSVSGNDLTLREVDSTDYTDYVSGGKVHSTYYEVSNSPVLGSENNTISWSRVSGVDRYDIYKRIYGLFTFIGSTQGTSFRDDGIEPDGVNGPPRWRDPFTETGRHPQCGTYWEQRRWFSGSHEKPETLYGSQAGAYDNFTSSNPSADSDAITRAFNDEESNDVRHLVSVSDLLVLTGGASRRVWSVDGALTPKSIVTKPQTREGASHVEPFIARNRVVYVEQNGRRVLDLSYNLAEDAFAGSDRTILVEHLTRERRIIEWAYAASEHMAWVLYDDGEFAAFSYMPDQDVWAWVPGSTRGDVESIEVIQDKAGGKFDTTVYLHVRRIINGTERRFIEYMTPRHFEEDPDAYFVDCGLSLDDPKAIQGYTTTNPVVVTAVNHGLGEGQECDIAGVRADDPNATRPVLHEPINFDGWVASNVTADTFELHDSDGNPVDGTDWLEYAAGGAVRATVTRVRIPHLAGANVVACANGHAQVDLVADADGWVELIDPASRVHVGLAYDAYFETNDLAWADQRGVATARLKNVAKLYLKVERSMGLEAGRHDKDPVLLKQGRDEMTTGVIAQTIRGSWDRAGRIRVAQPFPLPMKVLTVTVDPESE